MSERCPTVPVTHCQACRRHTQQADTYCAECGAKLRRRFQAKALTGHTSPETAYLVADYPYGFRLRCAIRYWIEFKKGHGFRFVSQTSNPKRPGLVWNAPKRSTYSPVMVLTVDDRSHVGPAALGAWEDEATIAAFECAYADALTDDHARAIRELRVMNAAAKHVTYTVRAAGTYHPNFETGKLELDPDSEGAENAHVPAQTRDEVAAVWSRAIALGMQSVDAAASAGEEATGCQQAA